MTTLVLSNSYQLNGTNRALLMRGFFMGVRGCYWRLIRVNLEFSPITAIADIVIELLRYVCLGNIKVPAIGLLESLTLHDSILSGYNESENIIVLPDHRHHIYSPGCLVLLAAFVKEKEIPEGGVIFPEKRIMDYAEAIGFSKAVWDHDTYKYMRKNEGKTYSPLVHLNNEEATDKASEVINNCIRHFFNSGEHDVFINELCDLVGDLHSNVWAHGKASGFSMAQKNKVPNTAHDYCLEFALADHGMGFLRELRRVGMEIDNDQDAIDWCVQEGHSTKKTKPEDDWAQSVPDDMIDNPFRGIETTKRSDNHHMGLGLFKLIQLVTKFSGELRIASGNKIFLLAANGKETYKDSIYPWQGVAISCRFDTGLINGGDEAPIDTGAQDVLGLLRIS